MLYRLSNESAGNARNHLRWRRIENFLFSGDLELGTLRMQKNRAFRVAQSKKGLAKGGGVGKATNNGLGFRGICAVNERDAYPKGVGKKKLEGEYGGVTRQERA